VKTEAGEFDPKQWLIDVKADFCLHKPTGLGFHIDFLPAEFAAGFIGIAGFVATPIPLRSTHAVPSAEIAPLARQAVELFVLLQRRQLHPSIPVIQPVNHDQAARP